MPLPPLKDLVPQTDVTGGSPKTPVPGIPVSDYQSLIVSDSFGVWKVVATGACSLLLGFIVAWWTALQSRGITQKELQDYAEKYLATRSSVEILTQQQARQDSEIGNLIGYKDRTTERLNANESKIRENEHDLIQFKTDTQTKINLATDYLEEIRKGKK